MLPAAFRRPRFLILVAAILVAHGGADGHLPRRTARRQREQLAFSEFLQQLDAGGGDTRSRSGDRAIDVSLRDGRESCTRSPRPSSSPRTRASSPTWSSAASAWTSRRSPDPAALGYGTIATAVAFFGLICFTVYRTTAGRIPNSGRARNAERGQNVITFHDVAGVDEAKDEVKEIVDFLREPGALLGDRRAHPEGRAARRPSRHRQDAARAIDRRRGGRAVPVRERLGLRRDVRRRRRVAHPQAVQGRAPPSVVHHLHRRARRRRPQPRRQLAQPRGARADAQSAARRDGRLRAATRASSSSPRPTGRTSSIRRCCGPAASIGR